MTFTKMFRVLGILSSYSGTINATAGGEIVLNPVEHLSKWDHDNLIRLEFVHVGCSYIYRPRRR